MPQTVIVDAVRTPIGKRNGVLRHWHPVDLAATTLQAVVERNDVDPGIVDDVVLGCVMQVGEQSVNVARNAVLAAGWPVTVPATTVDRQCGSGQQAIQFATQAIMAGQQDVVVAGGIEMMTRVPMGSTMADGKYGYPYGPSLSARFVESGGLVSQGVAAELIAEKWNLTRGELDEFAARSQDRAIDAWAQGRFELETIPITNASGVPITVDEGIRESPVELLSQLAPSFIDGGVVTAGNSSQISDGAAAILLMSDTRAEQLGVTPLARVVEQVVVADDPRLMLTAPIPATRKVLARAGMSMSDIDLFEVNEAFASVVLAWSRETGADLDRVNVNGGAIALGHPLGASGARMLATLVHELGRRGGGVGLQTMCEGGGLANALIVETLSTDAKHP